MSKVLSPGLRVGWMVAQAELLATPAQRSNRLALTY
jgi:DNA-binding transcriptional MocR family regulator